MGLTTRVTARPRAEPLMVAVCGENLDWEGHSCPPLPPPNLNGKEGVNGSSPLEGFLGSLYEWVAQRRVSR